MGLRKQIYIPDQEIWESIQKAAKSQGRSVSNYLMQLHKKHIRYGNAPTDQEIIADTTRKIKAMAEKPFFKPMPKKGKK